MSNNIITMILIVAVIILGGVSFMQHKAIREAELRDLSFAQAFGRSGIIEQTAEGNLIVNTVVRVKDVQQPAGANQ